MKSALIGSVYPRTKMLKIGILGGSFNPAHVGHREISLAALKTLCLHQVWWCITPQNPLKQAIETQPLTQRLHQALKIAAHPKIKVTTLEQQFNIQYTLDTIHLLQQRFANTHFILLMGADNLGQMSRWYRWQDICRTIPIAVFARPGYSLTALHSKAAQFLRPHRLTSLEAKIWWKYQAPTWFFLHDVHNPISSTKLRHSPVKS